MFEQVHAVSGNSEAPNSPRMDPEVPARARRRRFSKAYKLKVLAEADRCSKPGEIGLLLRREGLYSSQLSNWRKWRKEMTNTSPKAQPGKLKQLRNENARLERANKRLALKLKRAEAMLELQKKAAAMLETLEQPCENDC